MSKWVVRVELADPDDYTANELNDLVRWALEDNAHTSDMQIGAITIKPQEGSVSHVPAERHRVRRR
jgi:hypothetical protein